MRQWANGWTSRCAGRNSRSSRMTPASSTSTFWLDYFKRTKSDAVCLSGGGCVAYYPTQIPFHHRSQWLGDRDVFGELVAGCRKLGMVVIARTDPHATYDDVQQAHPGLDRRGRRRQTAPALGVAGDVGHVRARPLQLRVHDRGEEGDHVALSRGRHFHQSLGRLRHVLLRALPEEFQRRVRLRAAAHQQPARPGAPRLHSLAAATALRSLAALGSRSAQDQSRLVRHSQHRRRRDQFARHEKNRRTRAHAHGRPPGAPRPDAAVGQRARTRRNFARRWAANPSSASSASASKNRIAGRTRCRTAAEIRLWVADGVANGLRPWFTKFAGVLHDERWLKPVEEDLSPLRPLGEISAQRTSARARGWSIRSRPRGSTAARSRTTSTAGIRR